MTTPQPVEAGPEACSASCIGEMEELMKDLMEIFLPTLHTFENNNIFTGSCGLLRFRASPRRS